MENDKDNDHTAMPLQQGDLVEEITTRRVYRRPCPVQQPAPNAVETPEAPAGSPQAAEPACDCDDLE